MCLIWTFLQKFKRGEQPYEYTQKKIILSLSEIVPLLFKNWSVTLSEHFVVLYILLKSSQHTERMLSLCNSYEFGTPLTSRSHKGVLITPGICLKNLIRFKNTTAEKDRNYINSMGSASCFKLHFEITWFWVLDLPFHQWTEL